MNYAITGATGQLGQLVVSQLKAVVPAESIIALARQPERVTESGVQARAFDYTQPESLAEALAGVDVLLLISGNEIGQRYNQHVNVLNAAKAAGVKHVVYTSLLRADSSQISLAGEHLATERYLQELGVDYTILRNGWYSENYLGSIGGILAGGAVIGSTGNAPLSLATRADYAAAAVAALTSSGHEGKVYELAGDETVTLSDLAAEISRQTGRDIPYRDLPEAEYSAILAGFGLPDYIAPAIASWDVAAAHGDLREDGRQLSQLIGRPTTPLTQAVAAALATV